MTSIRKELAKGAKVEMEHWLTIKKLKSGVKYDDEEIAKMIAEDHLRENPLYYHYLAKMEKQMKKRSR
jgi:hypothetical protein